MENATDHEHLTEIVQRKRRRLRELQKQQAIYGLETPPAITIEIRETERELSQLERLILEPVPLATLSDAERFQALSYELRLTRQNIGDQAALLFADIEAMKSDIEATHTLFVAARRDARVLIILLVIWLTVITALLLSR